MYKYKKISFLTFKTFFRERENVVGEWRARRIFCVWNVYVLGRDICGKFVQCETENIGLFSVGLFCLGKILSVGKKINRK